MIEALFAAFFFFLVKFVILIFTKDNSQTVQIERAKREAQERMRIR